MFKLISQMFKAPSKPIARARPSRAPDEPTKAPYVHKGIAGTITLSEALQSASRHF